MQKLACQISLLFVLPALLQGVDILQQHHSSYASPMDVYCSIENELDDYALLNLMVHLAEEKQKSDLASATLFALEAEKIATSLRLNHPQADVYHYLGYIAWLRNNITESTQYYFKALNIRTHIGDSIGMARTCMHIGRIFSQRKDKRKADYYYNTAISISNVISDSIGIVDGYVAMGISALHSSENLNAYQYLQKAYTLAQQLEDSSSIAFTLVSLGQFHLHKGNFLAAQPYYNKAITIYKKIVDQPNTALCLSALAQCLLQHQNTISQAKEKAEKALYIADALKLPVIQAEALSVLSAFHQLSENYKKAFQFEQRRLELHKKLTNELLAQTISTEHFDYIERRQQVLNLQPDNELFQQKQHNIKLWKTFTLSFLGMVIIFIFAMYSKLRLETQTNQQLEGKNVQLQETNAALEQFAYIASHDLKEPLRTISSFTNLLGRKYQPVLDEKGKEYIAYITNGVSHMGNLLEDLLLYSRLLNKENIEKTAVNLNQVITSVKSALHNTIAERNAMVRFHNMPTIYANSSQMHQLFQNLITNGVKFNDNETPLVEITCDQKSSHYLFSVKDNGIGIDKSFHHKIFEMFQRLSKSEYPGTGIGLAICQKIVAMNDGKIWLTSEKGKGSTFYFTLPLNQVN